MKANSACAAGIFSLLNCASALFGLFAFLLPAILPAQPQNPESAGDGDAGQEINEEEYAKDSTTEINVKNADLAAIVRIFSKKTKRNYILDERVKGKVSIYLPGKVSAEESIRILDSVLSYKGFTTVPIGQNLWKIVPSKEARQSTIPTVIEGDAKRAPAQTMVTRLVQLKFVAAEEVKQLVSQLISPDGLVNSYAGTNSLIMIDSEDNIARLLKIIGALDVPSSSRDMTIVPIVYADAVDIAAKLNEILGEGSGSGKGGAAGEGAMDLIRARMQDAAARAAAAPGSGQPAGLAVPPQGGAGAVLAPLAKQPKIIADERTNSVIIVADEDITARVRALISQLDSQIDLSGMRFYVYRCQHAKADELADVLSGLGGSSGSSVRSSGIGGDTGTDLISGSGSTRSGTKSRGSQFSRTQSRIQTQSRTPGRSRSESRNTTGAKGVTLGEDVSITADPATNSLIIFAGKTDYEKIKSLLEKLDIKRRQVLVEAILLEVGIDDSQAMGTSFLGSIGGADGGMIASNNAENLANLLKDPSAVKDFSMAAASAGSLTLPNESTIPTQMVLLEAARSNSSLNILSAPTILTTDNEQAEIVVGQNVPFLASTATSDENLNNTFNQIDRQDVGITLRLTPQISSGDSVTLKIFTEVSTVVSTDPRLGPTTGIRTSETAVITKDGQMVVTGGLMSDDINEAESGVPYLKDIPFLGHMFRTTSERRRRTNLLILITPRIIKDQYDARDATIAKRNVMEHEIRAYEAYPSREEVLRNLEIDRVAESSTFEGQGPSTILAPQDAQEKAHAGQADAAGVLEFKVNPQVPAEDGETTRDPSKDIPANDKPPDDAGVATRELSAPTDKSGARESFYPSSGAKADRESAGDIFIVVKVNAGQELRQRTPFNVSPEDAVAGIIVPADVAQDVRSFFRVGKPYAYKVDEQKLDLSPVGIFASADEAREFYPEISQNWYTLSPHEIMNLGDGPWVKLE